MRRLFWSGTAAMVASAAAVFFAADQATRQPNSLVGRSTLFAYEVGAAYQPFALFSEMICRQMGAMVNTVATAGPTLPEAKACPEVICQARNITSETEPVTREELQRLHLLSLLHSPEALIPFTPKPERPQPQDFNPKAETKAALPLQTNLSTLVVTVGKEEIWEPAERESAPRIMPLAIAYDETKVPTHMPVAEGFDKDPSENIPSRKSFWTTIFQKASSIVAGAEEVSVEESAAIQGSLPGFHEFPTTFSSDPGCPLIKRNSKADGPSTGILSGDKKKELTGPFEQKSATYKPLTLEGDHGDKESQSPAQQHIDTMEFRPSDAQEGEFDNHPM